MSSSLISRSYHSCQKHETYLNQRQYDEAVEAKPADGSLEGADLEPGAHASPVPQSEVPVEYGGRNVLKYKGTPQIWPEVWQMLSKRKKLEEIAKYQQSLKNLKLPHRL